jgi:hypothetical protein
VKEQSENINNFATLADHLNIRLQKALGPHAWLGRTLAGTDVVIKKGPGAELELHNFLLKCNTLYPSFDHPQIIAAEPGFYLLYDFIHGDPLSSRNFESEDILAAVFDLSGRVTALCRSLKLALMFQGLQRHAARREDLQEFSSRRLAALGSGLDYQSDGLAIRRHEASRSYAWAQEIVESCACRWPERDFKQMVPWEALRQRVESVTSIHLTSHGSNLSHINFTPEHILITGENRWGLVGWQVAPRPYNYMRYKYLAWSLTHTLQGEIENRYRHNLQMMPTIHPSAADLLTFALCLLETWVDAREKIELRAEKLQAVLHFIENSLAIAEEDKA